MLSWRMADGGIRVGSPPRQDGRTINNQVACANEPTPDGGQHAQHKERF